MEHGVTLSMALHDDRVARGEEGLREVNHLFPLGRDGQRRHGKRGILQYKKIKDEMIDLKSIIMIIILCHLLITRECTFK